MCIVFSADNAPVMIKAKSSVTKSLIDEIENVIVNGVLLHFKLLKM